MKHKEWSNLIRWPLFTIGEGMNPSLATETRIFLCHEVLGNRRRDNVQGIISLSTNGLCCKGLTNGG